MSFPWAIYYYFISPVISIVIVIVFASIIMSWLMTFNVVNPHNQFVRTIYHLLNSVSAPLLAPFRRFIPPLGGLDFSPIVLLLALRFLDAWAIPELLMATVGPPR